MDHWNKNPSSTQKTTCGSLIQRLFGNQCFILKNFVKNSKNVFVCLSFFEDYCCPIFPNQLLYTRFYKLVIAPPTKKRHQYIRKEKNHSVLDAHQMAILVAVMVFFFFILSTCWLYSGFFTTIKDGEVLCNRLCLSIFLFIF